MKLVLYTKAGCPWCDEVRTFLSEKKVSFAEREVRGNPTYFEELKAKSGQEKTPTLDLDGVILADADAPTIEKFLKERNMLQ